MLVGALIVAGWDAARGGQARPCPPYSNDDSAAVLALVRASTRLLQPAGQLGRGLEKCSAQRPHPACCSCAAIRRADEPKQVCCLFTIGSSISGCRQSCRGSSGRWGIPLIVIARTGVRRAHWRHACAAALDDRRLWQHLPVGLPGLRLQARPCCLLHAVSLCTRHGRFAECSGKAAAPRAACGSWSLPRSTCVLAVSISDFMTSLGKASRLSRARWRFAAALLGRPAVPDRRHMASAG